MAKKNELSVSEQLPAYLKNMDPNDTRGSENVSQEDLIIPRLALVQAISPELKEKEPEYIEGIKQGQMFNTVTREVYGTEVVIVPVVYEMQYIPWKDRKQGGGFGGQYPTYEEAVEAINQMEDPDNWAVTDTPTHLCLVLYNNTVQEIAIPLPKSKAKVSRQFNTMVRMFGGPRFSRAYKVQSVEDQNNVGDDFWNFKITPAGFPPESIYYKAEELYNDISSGKLNYQVDSEEPKTDESQEDAIF